VNLEPSFYIVEAYNFFETSRATKACVQRPWRMGDSKPAFFATSLSMWIRFLSPFNL